MNIALIGASGFVGTRLLDLLKESTSYELKNIDLQPSHFFPEITVLGDVRKQTQMDKELAGTDCDLGPVHHSLLRRHAGAVRLHSRPVRLGKAAAVAAPVGCMRSDDPGAGATGAGIAERRNR